MMTEQEYRRRMFWGRLAYWLFMALPTFIPFRWTRPLWAPSGFYAHDDGYAAYVARVSPEDDA